MKIKAEMGAYSSVLGNSVHLVAEDGRMIGQVAILCHTDELRNKKVQTELCNTICDAINRKFTPAPSSAKPCKPSTKYAHMNHHHELNDDYEVVNFSGCEFIANKAAIPLLAAIDGVGLRTRTHHVEPNAGFVSILLDEGVTLEVRKVFERDATRYIYNGQTELLLQWYNPKAKDIAQ